VDRINSS